MSMGCLSFLVVFGDYIINIDICTEINNLTGFSTVFLVCYRGITVDKRYL